MAAIDPTHTAQIRRPLPALRLLLRIGSLLVLLGGTQLFVFSERTDEFFAWTIAAPLTAAIDGAFFYTGFVLLFPASRASTWAEVRPVAFAVLVVATLKLLATLLHLEPFHFEDPRFITSFAAWAWLVVYIVIPIGLAVLISLQLRQPGTDPDGARPLGRLLAGAFTAIAVVMLSLGAVLLLAADVAAEIWPWPLTALTSHALSAWFIGVGVLAALTVLENDLERSRSTMAGALMLGVMLAVALARYSGDIQWDRALAWVLIALIVALVAFGAYGLLAGRTAAAARWY